MDRKDEQDGGMEEIYQQLRSAYCQFMVQSHESCRSGCLDDHMNGDGIPDPEKLNPGLIHSTPGGSHYLESN